MDNVILTYENIELYKSEIDILCNDYISELNDENMIYKSTVFSGMLNHIYNNKLKFIIPDTYNNNYALLDDIFHNVYIYLCSKYNICPSIIQFCVLCHIDRTTIAYIHKGVYSDGSKVKKITFDTIEKWYSTCESMLLSKAQNENSIGSIFALKANYKYRDNDSVQLLQIDTSNIPDASAIMEKYRDVKKPELIEFNDN